jgi:hypothetical protein
MRSTERVETVCVVVCAGRCRTCVPTAVDAPLLPPRPASSPPPAQALSLRDSSLLWADAPPDLRALGCLTDLDLRRCDWLVRVAGAIRHAAACVFEHAFEHA